MKINPKTPFLMPTVTKENECGCPKGTETVNVVTGRLSLADSLSPPIFQDRIFDFRISPFFHSSWVLVPDVAKSTEHHLSLVKSFETAFERLSEGFEADIIGPFECRDQTFLLWCSLTGLPPNHHEVLCLDVDWLWLSLNKLVSKIKPLDSNAALKKPNEELFLAWHHLHQRHSWMNSVLNYVATKTSNQFKDAHDKYVG
ncbi:MAG: hypothetical protein ACLQVY_13965 [Limisphaerales bacterium]